jgi:histidyl-tRNA synthetase
VSEVKKIKPSLSKGTRDFLPRGVAKRNYIFDVIKGVFRKYGFEQIETPAIERLETLMGKYGEEGDKLLFKILNSGDYLKDIPAGELTTASAQQLLKYVAEKGLRYDLTVPLARYVVMHQDELAFPFKRFHIGPVWRADRPQKGRYQEFYQCDADVIGSTSLLNEVELTMIYAEVFENLKLKVQIHVSSRKFLHGLVQLLSAEMFAEQFYTLLDKLDKMETQAFIDLLNNISPNLGGRYRDLMFESFKGSRNLEEAIAFFKGHFSNINSELGLNGLHEIESLFKFIQLSPNFGQKFHFNFSLARGLTYYSGVIWEIVLDTQTYKGDFNIGSLGGGGRYDNLTEMFGGQNMSGVGISFGIERIYDVMEELNLFPPTIAQGVKVLLVPRDEAMEEFTFQQTQMLRDAGIPAEIFLGNVKKQKHFQYVEAKNIAHIIEIGSNEKDTGKFRLRNAKTRETEIDLTLEQIIERLS